MHQILQTLKLTLLHLGYAKLDTSWDYDNVISPFSRLYLITKGRAKLYHSYEEFNLREGYLYLVPSYTYSRYQCDAYHEQFYLGFLEEVGNSLSIYNHKSFRYECKATEADVKYFKRLLQLNPNRTLTNDDPKIYDNRKALLEFEKRNESLTSRDFLETHALIQALFSRFISDAGSGKINTRNDFNEVLAFIKEHLHEELGVADLAGHFHMSPDHFSRVFQQRFGLRPSKYMQTVRIERSETLLITTNHSLKEIAAKTGWGNVSYYSRIFKQVTGMTPGQFRNEHQSP